MRVVDLFCGLKGWSKPFAERGHETFTLDFDPRFDADITADILDVVAHDFPWRPDIVLASPPCEKFSVLQIGRNWTPPPANEPKTDGARHAVKIVRATSSSRTPSASCGSSRS